MAKIIIKIGAGTFEAGFDANVTINQEGQTATAVQSGRLLPAPNIPQLYQDWKSAYYGTPVVRQALRIQIPETQETNVSIQKCRDAADALVYQIIQWYEKSLNLQRLIERQVRSDEPMRVFIQTDNVDIWKLPWHLWSLLTDHPNSELAFITDNFHNISITSIQNSLKILGILGNDEKIQIEEDHRLVEELRNKGAQIEWLQKPSIGDVVDKLIAESWDILFFAGHSYTDKKNQGVIQINDQDSLFVTDLKYVLKKAVANGLKLAIFNSCDGIGLAKNLADLNIPYILVMKEPVPDRVAQLFLKYFLEHFSKGKSLNQSVDYARERLRIDEVREQLPGASWLPLIYQNPNVPPLVWIQSQQQVVTTPEPPVSLLKTPNPIWTIWLNKWSRIPKNTRVAIALLLPFLLSISLIIIVRSRENSNQIEPPNINSDNSDFLDERISLGDKLFITDQNRPEKKAGVQAFKEQNYELALFNFEASLRKEPNQPETLIYKNNTQAQTKNPLKIAVVVPITSNLDFAQEMLRGVAMAQNKINKAGGIKNVGVG
jgi:branched-chain amino acid transport system substrate-binding protein